MINEEWIEYYVYLEELRQSGVTNMFGAGADNPSSSLISFVDTFFV